MVNEQKMERRGEAVKRLRSLFDMHHIAFGTPDKLGGLMLSLHENRHFTMDFWSVVNTLSEDGSGSLNNEEMLEAVVESATGVDSSVLPEYERPGVHELRLMLSGVDVARPAPIAKPADALLSNQDAAPKFSARAPNNVATPSNDDALQSRRSIGEALAKLEQSTRELREQLGKIDAQIGAQSVEARSLPVETQLAEVKPDQQQPSETIARWNSIASSPSVIEEHPAMQEASEQVASSLAEAVSPRTPAPIPAPITTPIPVRPPAPQPLPSVASVLATAPVIPVASPTRPVAETKPPEPVVSEREVFAPRPAHTLSQRGLALPEPDDDPAIVAPLSAYAAASEPSRTGRYIIAVIVIAILAAGGFMGARTQAGHTMLQNAGLTIRDKYNSLVGNSPSTTTVDSKPAESLPAEAKDSSETQPVSSSAQTQQQPSNTTAAPEAPPVPTPSASSQPVSPASSSVAAPVAAGRTKTSETAPRPRAAQPFVDTSVLRVPASTMAANLITSRVPAYPEAARAQEIEGPVVLEAVISESGFVRYARAIDGDPHLRAAAEDAVLRWRYKPYLLDGAPVEISTTIRVDFRLPQ